ncbi:MAG: SoxR reducing system RseC family protein [Rhodocyclaceae bacterium]|nr:SoxR reducing system RseC family protein [Rhodocyclaceae bacterium]MBX3668374.1 SoxR reducing system RseC family protein [Rhodocyclaceae bacterium]
MMERVGIVRRVSGGEVFIECSQTAGCGHCADPGGCGGGGSDRALLLRARNSCDARVGERLVVCMPDGMALAAAFSCYMLPLLAGLLAALGVLPFVSDDLRDVAAAIAFCGGAVLGFLAARRIGRRLGGTHTLTLRRACATDR